MSCRILSISDIHFKENYKGKDFILNYFHSLKLELSNLHKTKAIDLVLLCGDIAYSGDNAEYYSFYDLLKENLPAEIPIVSVVGNHDVFWTSLSLALNGKELTEIFDEPDNKIIEDCKSPKGKYRGIFRNFYSVFHEKTSKSFHEKNQDRFEYKFDDANGYCGYLHDKQEKLFFLLLNSSWYSFGKGVLDTLYKNITENKGLDEIKKYCSQFIDGSLSQNGKQSYFLSFYPFFGKLEKAKEKDPDTRIIAVSHHPPSWLKWEEQFNKSEGRSILLDRLLRKTDLLITGHLHNPVAYPVLLNNSCFHFSNGAFLEYSFVDKFHDDSPADPIDAFPNNWFTIIDVNTSGFQYKSYKFKTELTEMGFSQYRNYWEVGSEGKRLAFIDRSLPHKDIAFHSSRVPKVTLSECLPSDTQKIELIIEKRRKNKLRYLAPHVEVKPRTLYTYHFDNKYNYYLYVNSIEYFHDLFSPENSMEAILKNPTFINLFDLLTLATENKLPPVLAFYEFYISSGPSREGIGDEYQEEEMQKFLKFQSFKHQFFEKFQKFDILKELSIVFDCFIV